MSALTLNMPTAMPFLVQRISFQALPFAQHATETRVESTTACLAKAWQIWHPSTVWMHPFAIKGLESQYTGNATPPRGDTDGTVTTRGLMTTSR